MSNFSDDMSADEAIAHIAKLIGKVNGFKFVRGDERPAVVAFAVEDALRQLKDLRVFRGDIQRAINDADELFEKSGNGGPGE